MRGSITGCQRSHNRPPFIRYYHWHCPRCGLSSARNRNDRPRTHPHHACWRLPGPRAVCAEHLAVVPCEQNAGHAAGSSAVLLIWIPFFRPPAPVFRIGRGRRGCSECCRSGQAFQFVRSFDRLDPSGRVAYARPPTGQPQTSHHETVVSPCRAVYATVLERWLGIASPPILGGRFGLMDLFRS